MQEEPKLKKLPWSPNRGEVKQLYPGISREDIREEINIIVEANRKHHPPEKKKKPGSLYPSEFIELMRVLGPPEGYEISPWMERQIYKTPKL